MFKCKNCGEPTDENTVLCETCEREKGEASDNGDYYKSDEVYTLPFQINTPEAHTSVFSWLESRAEERFVRDDFTISKMEKRYYNFRLFWFNSKIELVDLHGNPVSRKSEIILLPASGDVPRDVTAVAAASDFMKICEYTQPVPGKSFFVDNAKGRAFAELQKRQPQLFDEYENLLPGVELALDINLVFPAWEGSYRYRGGREYRFYINGQTGETSGEKASGFTLSSFLPGGGDRQSDETREPVKKAKTAVKETAQPKPPAQKKAAPQQRLPEGISPAPAGKSELKKYLLIAAATAGVILLLFLMSRIAGKPADPEVSPSSTASPSAAASASSASDAGKPATPPPSPEPVRPSEQEQAAAVIRENFQAINDSDFDKVYSLRSRRWRDERTADTYRQMYADNERIVMENVAAGEIAGDTALVSAKFVSYDKRAAGTEKRTCEMNFTLIREEGRWVIDDSHLVSETVEQAGAGDYAVSPN